jgi:Protein of unknown function (DUF3040)
VLSENEQRALEELERGYATEAVEPVRPHRAPRRPTRRPGHRVVLVGTSLSAVLLVVGVPAAALALALATAVCWLFWRLWSHRTDDGSMSAPPDAHGQEGADRRPGGSIRQYLRWLSEAE